VISGINLGRWGRDFPVVGRQSLVVGKPGSFPNSNSLPVIDNNPRTTTDQRLATASKRLATNDQRLPDLVQAILQETSLEKVRISSVEPMDWSDELIELMATSSRIAKHAHVPLQSASDAVLRRMHRKYRPWHYREKIMKIRNAMPSAAIGADVMVGFPGETESEFAETRRMIEDLPFTYLHVFTYSARPGTPAAAHIKQVPVAVASERSRVLREITAAKRDAFMRAQVGKIVEAITLRSRDGESTEALTDNYLKMKIPGRLESNRWFEVRVQSVEDNVLEGTNVLAVRTAEKTTDGSNRQQY